MVSKMPSNAQDRWTRKTLNIRKRQSEEPCLQHFLDFMKDETLLVSDPVFSIEAMNCRSENDDKNPKRPSVKNNVKTFNVNIQDDTVRRKDDSLNCLRCNDSHHLDNCEKFITDSIEERVQFLTENALCYACCEPMTSWHNSRSCRKRLICKTCHKRQPTCLHGRIYKGRGEEHKRDENKGQTTRSKGQLRVN